MCVSLSLYFPFPIFHYILIVLSPTLHLFGFLLSLNYRLYGSRIRSVGFLTQKADVYSFGVVALEIVAGKNNMQYRPSEEFVCLLDWALYLQKKGSLMRLVDARLGSEFERDEAEKMIRVALLCTSPSPALRPTMSEVVSMLGGHISIQEFNMDPGIYQSELKLQALREKFDGFYLDSTQTQTQTQIQTLTEPTQNHSQN